MDQLILPVIPLRSSTLLPGMTMSVDISRAESLTAAETAVKEGQGLFLVTQRSPQVSEPKEEDLFETGTVAQIRSVARLPKGIMHLVVSGTFRARRSRVFLDEKCFYTECERLEDIPETLGKNEQEGMLRALKDILQRYSLLNQKFSKESMGMLMEQQDLGNLMKEALARLPIHYLEQQKMLEILRLTERYQRLLMVLAAEIEVLSIRNEIQQKVKQRIDKNQRDYILREQMKIIQEELGETTLLSEAEQFKKKADELEAPEEVKEKIRKEADRLAQMGNNNAESSVLRGYIETLLEMPWNRSSKDYEDLKHAAKVLDEDHYGLEKVKERVLEFLAVRTMTHKGESPIICLAGPPGTGKTSIARSIARALDKKYVRISLGGVRDEAEIRGHRRTYVGAMPGRIASGMRQAGVKNPLMLLDEIDKVSSDYKGDTASALLEVLDSEQNVRFRDHYIELPIDLSEVMFITTANDLHTIARPLLDRMEIIEVSGYTANEKYHIAREHLFPRQLERNGLTKSQLVITKGAMEKLISGYTREAGVRQLERRLGELCRKAARPVAADRSASVRVTEKGIEKYLGKPKFTYLEKNEEDEVGIVRGLAWTSVGGDTLQVEVNVLPGKGGFVLTGQMGDVMKESAQTAVSYVRSISESYGISPEFFSEHDLHIHIPEGAVPKDGPSAGITMATAILSAVTQIEVRSDVAMTGEITLRGRVLPIGGLKEKLLAAGRAGLRQVLVPWKNRADVAELSDEIIGNLEIVYVKTMQDVLKAALVNGEKK